MKRAFGKILVGCLFLAFCVVFGKSIFLSSVCGIAKAYLKYAKNLELNYSKAELTNSSLVINNAEIETPCGKINTPILSISYPSKEVHFLNPRVEILSLKQEVNAATPAIESRNPLKGFLDLLGMDFPSSFSLRMDDGELLFEKKCLGIHAAGSKKSISVELTENFSKLSLNRNEEGVVSVHAKEFDLSFFPLAEGCIDGEALLEKRGSNWNVLSSSVCLDGLGIRNLFENFSGFINFAGPIYGYDLLGLLENAKLRLTVDRGTCSLGTALNGVLSFDGKAGAKWDFTFKNQDQEMGSSGKGFFYSVEGRWIESTLFSNSSVASVLLRDNPENYAVNFYAESVQKELISWIKDAALYFGAKDPALDFEKGTVTGQGFVCIQKQGGISWEIQDCQIDDLHLRANDLLIGCEKATVKEGSYDFSGGSFSLANKIGGSNWSGKGDIPNFFGSISGELGSLTLDANYRGNFDLLFASLKVGGLLDGEMSLQGSIVDDGFQFAIRDGFGTLFPSYTIESLCLDGEVSGEGVTLTNVKGVLDAGKKIPFYAPIMQTEGSFDLRFESPLFDVARFAGSASKGNFHLDTNRSHFLGSFFQNGKVSVNGGGIDSLDVSCHVPWKTLPYFIEVPEFFDRIEDGDTLFCNLSFDRDIHLKLGSTIASLFDADLNITKANGKWVLHPSTVWNWDIRGDFAFEKEGLFITQAVGKSLDGLQAEFSGRISSLDSFELKLSHLFVDLTQLDQAKDLAVEGTLEGEGMIHWKGGLESDFDFTASGLKLFDVPIESEVPLNFSGSSKNGLLVRGLSLAVNHLNESARCKVGLFQYAPDVSQLVFADTEFDLSSNFLETLGLNERVPDFARDFFNQPLLGTADLTLTPDLSTVGLSMRRADIVLEEEPYTLQNLHFDLAGNQRRLNFDLVHPSKTIPIDLAFSQDPHLKGRLTIENGLKVDFSYENELKLEAIEGKCSGVEASFQKETDFLIGSARINGNELRNFLPSKIAKVFSNLKIGDGYELMGRLAIKERDLCFRGLLSGKQIELFGFEFKNILGRIEWDADHFLVSDLKVSDFAGVLKVDQIYASKVDENPWTLSIPHITVTELRPSLLQDVQGPPGEISPLVIRQLKIDDFKGVLEDSNSYTASGELFFINSYKRGNSLLELPSDFLSRIIGLDLDLLVPVCGSLKYELRDGFFNLTELSGSYSENKRSEFFLSFDERAPQMDLDWNLNILIGMKQFVLFKFTEAFMISVTGKLDDPKFNLQRKKRFFGVL